MPDEPIMVSSYLDGVSLFAGVGGFDLAMERAGIRVTAMSEIDKDCRGVLTGHFPDSVLFGDVTEVTASDIIGTGFDPARGILTAGWPCQGNSVAGHRKGLADPRSGLWRQVERILGELRPRWFVGENVPGLLTVRGGADFWEVVKSLDELGYGVAWRVLDAQNFGIPQRRRRVLIAGCLADPSGAAQVLLEPESSGGDSETRPPARARVAGTLASSAGGGGLGGIGQSANAITSRIVETASTLQGGGRRGYRIDAESAAGGQLVVFNPYRTMLAKGEYVEGFKPDAIHDCLTANPPPKGPPLVVSSAVAAFHQNQRGELRETQVSGSIVVAGGKPGQGYPAVRVGMGVRRLTPLECERLQGFPDDWTAGQSDSARYRQLGNAVAVPVAEWLMRRIVAQEGIEDAA